MTLTIEDADLWRLKEHAHYNGGKEWFGYGHTCVEQPRLYRMDRYTRKDRSVKSTWSVDGQDCADLADAIEKLNHDPDLTDLDRDTLTRIPICQMSRSEFSEMFGDGWHTRIHWMTRKGLMVWEHGRGKITELGIRLRSVRQDAPQSPQGDDQ